MEIKRGEKEMNIDMAIMLISIACGGIVLFWFLENRHLKKCDEILEAKKK